MYRLAITAFLCAALGYAAGVSVAPREELRECRGMLRDARRNLDEAVVTLEVAREQLDLCEGIAGIWLETARWYQRAYLTKKEKDNGRHGRSK